MGAQRTEHGFTLPEFVAAGLLILVFALVALTLLRPLNVQAERRDAQRLTDVARILQAVNAYKADHGTLPPHITQEEAIIASEDADSGLCADLVPAYAADLPVDPSIGVKLEEELTCEKEEQVYASGYTIRADVAGAVTVAAPKTEIGDVITLTR